MFETRVRTLSAVSAAVLGSNSRPSSYSSSSKVLVTVDGEVACDDVEAADKDGVGAIDAVTKPNNERLTKNHGEIKDRRTERIVIFLSPNKNDCIHD